MAQGFTVKPIPSPVVPATPEAQPDLTPFSDTLTLSPPPGDAVPHEPEPSVASAQTAETPPQEPAPDTPTQAPADTGAQALPTHCPRCLYDLSQPWTVKPTDVDKQAFVVSMLGGTPFQKQFQTGGGRLGFVFSELSPDQEDLTLKQCHAELQRGEITTESQYLATLIQYRLCLSLKRILHDGAPRIAVPAVSEHAVFGYTPQSDGPTPLPALRDWVWKNALPTETLRRVAARHYQQFQRLVEAMEAEMFSPDF